MGVPRLDVGGLCLRLRGLDLSQMLINIDDDHFLLAADPDVPFEAIALLLHAQIQQKVTPHQSLGVQIRRQILIICKGCQIFDNFDLQLFTEMVNELYRIFKGCINLNPVLPVILLPQIPELIICDVGRVDLVQYFLSDLASHRISNHFPSCVFKSQVGSDIHGILWSNLQSLVQSDRAVFFEQHVIYLVQGLIVSCGLLRITYGEKT